jgi:hypothetical protein
VLIEADDLGPPCGLWEQGEEIIETRGDVLRIEAGHARGGELDREAEPVDAAADLAVNPSTRSATADTTCSQLSITRSTSRSVNQWVSASS